LGFSFRSIAVISSASFLGSLEKSIEKPT
jgi:hypothetical protein